jgi:glycosyltransferase involved in cell wall biosynthesis
MENLGGESTMSTFHIPAVPHVVANAKYSSCAYTFKAIRLSKMLKDKGHEVFFYGCEGAEVEATEFIPLVTNEYRRLFYTDNDNTENQYRFDINDLYHTKYFDRCAAEIKMRLGDKDFLLLPWGWGHKPIYDRLGEVVIPVESGVGYPDCCLKENRVFESNAWRCWVYGKEGLSNGNYTDTVIPNYYPPADFRYQEKKEDWFLYLGRIVQRKGVEQAVEMTRQIGAKLVIAGQGTVNTPEGIDLHADHVEFVGYATPEIRKDLMARAKAVICYTHYIGPFEGVSIEAAFSGTPTITSDWGCYPENILQGVTGYRCSTMAELVWAGENIKDIKPKACYDWAVNNFTMDIAAESYDYYFNRLKDIYTKPESLEWNERLYPEA